MTTHLAWLAAAALLSTSSSALAQFQTRWRDQRPQQSRPSPYLSLLTPGANRSVVYQGFVRPQLDLQSQVRQQDRQFDRYLSMSRETPGFSVRGGAGESATGGSTQNLLQTATLDRIRGTQRDAARLDVGHPVYFQYRDQYFPGFRRYSGAGAPGQ
jgi:hypothetical protein